MNNGKRISILSLAGLVIAGFALLFWWGGSQPVTGSVRPEGAMAVHEDKPPVKIRLPEAPSTPVSRIPDPWPEGRSPHAESERMPSPKGTSRGVRRLEETGPDVSMVSEARLIERLAAGAAGKDQDAMRAAWELGNRFLEGAWIPDEAQQRALNQVTAQLLDLGVVSSSDAYSYNRNQLYRLWSLAHPVLVESLDPQRKNLNIVVKTLVATRTPRLVADLVNRYQNETDEERRRLLAFTLSCMKEQRRISIPRRSVMSPDDSERLYAELIEPVLPPASGGLGK